MSQPKDLVEEIRWTRGNFEEPARTSWNQHLLGILLRAADEIERLRAERPAPGWVAVGDAMPEPNVAVAVFLAEYGTLDIAKHNGERWTRRTSSSAWFGMPVTHWTHLPELPQ